VQPQACDTLNATALIVIVALRGGPLFAPYE
jgi:hypothetical protein